MRIFTCALRGLHTQSRVPPRSLLIKQAIRLGKIKHPSNDQLISDSLKDLKAMFQPSASTQDDEDLDIIRKQNNVIVNVNNGKYTKLMVSKLGLVEKDMKFEDASILINNFKKLSWDELQFIIDATEYQYPNDTNWNKLPVFIKQLQYYIGYGSYGPRESIPFAHSNGIPMDFTYNHSSRMIQDKHQVIKRLSSERLTNINSIYKNESLDYFTKYVVIFS
ncbi:hypothetical protein TPHA_0J01740 [Tetrapisispora phaffii CBS 4417]|uniref:Uncharacterized protein n=1 Tax=Tetrapisispora phaffii (strain ATCC 24235 / CBS 4417 / NBRC 1672 / NRRL Y-8282 / UCD 70-5) TaxID=1071381 RepID=G8BYQ3_TETPH|nr:hypothetical protein TPHA_0J01740 [Tetrapisispora phaffii CBS 4417]CCE64995.1 hypothetical protein TPHA_0J01740 [Tetrapisispora phaffii CBS 4417]